MSETSPSLPPECVLRPACVADKWSIQKLVWEFTKAEVIEFDIRVISFRLLIVLGLNLALMVQRSMLLVNSTLLRLFLEILIPCTFVLIFVFTLSLVFYFKSIGALSHWSHYWVIECDQSLVACGAVSCYTTHSTIYHLFVTPAWRSQRLGSCLVKRLVQVAASPIYLVCKPKMVQFYTRLDFVRVPWHQLSQPLKRSFNIFKPHPKLRGFPLLIMQYYGEKDQQNYD